MFLLVSVRHVGAHPDGHQHDGAPTWRLHTNLYKFGEIVSPHILHIKNCCDLNLGKSLCIVAFSLFSDSGLNLLNVLIFILIYFKWRDTENKQLVPLRG